MKRYVAKALKAIGKNKRKARKVYRREATQAEREAFRATLLRRIADRQQERGVTK